MVVPIYPGEREKLSLGRSEYASNGTMLLLPVVFVNIVIDIL